MRERERLVDVVEREKEKEREEGEKIVEREGRESDWSGELGRERYKKL